MLHNENENSLIHVLVVYTPPKVLLYVYVLVSFVYLKDIDFKSYVLLNYKIIALIQYGFDFVDLVQDKI